MIRPTREQMFLEIAESFAKRSTCSRASVGALIVKSNHIIAHGYNGAPSGIFHCQGSDHSDEHGCRVSVHAEANAIAYAARVGVNCDGANLYCTHEPCYKCAQLIIQAGISSVLYIQPYSRDRGTFLLHQVGISCLQASQS